MKIDFYTKTILTIIAISLVVIAFKEVNVISSVKATNPSNNLKPGINYGVIPINSDGTINVHIESSSKTAFYNAEPIEVKISQ